MYQCTRNVSSLHDKNDVLSCIGKYLCKMYWCVFFITKVIETRALGVRQVVDPTPAFFTILGRLWCAPWRGCVGRWRRASSPRLASNVSRRRSPPGWCRSTGPSTAWMRSRDHVGPLERPVSLEAVRVDAVDRVSHEVGFLGHFTFLSGLLEGSLEAGSLGISSVG